MKPNDNANDPFHLLGVHLTSRPTRDLPAEAVAARVRTYQIAQGGNPLPGLALVNEYRKARQDRLATTAPHPCG